LHEADCVLQVGAVTFEKQYVDPNVTTVQALDKPDVIDPGRGSLALVGNLREILAALRDRLTLNDNAEWQEKISREKLHRSGLIDEQLANTSQPLHPAHVMAVLGDLVPADAVIVCDIGAHVHWFDSYFMANEQAVLISSRWRSLGAGLPGAIGAALAQPERTVVALVGDGGMLASLGALCTAVKYAVPVTVVIVNNRRYEIEAERMARRGMEPEGIDVPEPDFSALAASCGAWSRKVTSHDELTAAWHESRDVSGPVVLDVHVARAELPFLRG
ncbi:MAG: thiamine pyrophosphate-binding protein, partial [Firmicutes bacterium]|nr:thiamine pyrophosphate-binding protein [Bacillota bacterium]